MVRVEYHVFLAFLVLMVGLSGCNGEKLDKAQKMKNPCPEGAVDLGLSVDWAVCNIGATVPEEYGDYYAWGEITTKSNYSWSNYKWSNGSTSSLTKYNMKSSSGVVVDNKTVLDPDDDVAHVKLGGNWRMPTNEEWTELRTLCTWTWTTQNGVSGYKITSKKSGYTNNSIFLPAAGSWSGAGFSAGRGGSPWGGYWSSSLYTVRSMSAWNIGFDSGDVWDLKNDGERCDGLSVRAVTD